MMLKAVSEQYSGVVLAAVCFLTLCIYWFWNTFCARDSKAFRGVDLQTRTPIVVFIFHWVGDYWTQIATLMMKTEIFIFVTPNNNPWDSFKHNVEWILFIVLDIQWHHHPHSHPGNP